jgi:AcrR family transcriptional regulator
MTRRATSRPPRASGPRAPRPAPDTRARLLAAATDEFASRGFDGAAVDRIARRAGLNKAMIYYHFRNKQALYLEILRDMFASVGVETERIVATTLPPARKLDLFIETLMREARARPHFPPMMLREIAEGGRHLDRLTLLAVGTVFRSVVAILQQGQREGQFAPADPTLTYFTIVGPMIFYLASTPVRAALSRMRVMNAGLDPDVFVAHVQEMARRMVRHQPTKPGRRATGRARRPPADAGGPA